MAKGKVMVDIINKSSDSINMGELSKQNGRTEFENFKTIMEILMMKAKVYDIPQKVVLSFPQGNEVES